MIIFIYIYIYVNDSIISCYIITIVERCIFCCWPRSPVSLRICPRPQGSPELVQKPQQQLTRRGSDLSDPTKLGSCNRSRNRPPHRAIILTKGISNIHRNSLNKTRKSPKSADLPKKPTKTPVMKNMGPGAVFVGSPETFFLDLLRKRVDPCFVEIT